jgi:hypothetical protein
LRGFRGRVQVLREMRDGDMEDMSSIEKVVMGMERDREGCTGFSGEIWSLHPLISH